MASGVEMSVKQPGELLAKVENVLGANLFRKADLPESAGAPDISYIAAVSDHEHLLAVRDLVVKDESHQKVYDLNMPFLEALYVVFADSDALFFAVRDEYNSLDAAKLNFGIDSFIVSSLKQAMREKGLEALADYGLPTSIGIFCGIEWSIAHKHQIPSGDIYNLKMANTHELYKKYYRLYRDAPDPLAACFDSECEYQHIKTFSLYYYAMIRVMADVIGDSPDLVIHDAGTCTSQLVMLLAALSADELLNLQVGDVIASDLEAGAFNCIRRCMMQYEKKQPPIWFIQQDFLDETKELPEADVTILNDVLEHFPDDETAFKVFARFWQRTHRMLIVHVPFEETLGSEWGHHVLFTKAKLQQWANRLTGWALVGEDYPFIKDLPYMHSGFLMLQRTEPIAAQ